MATTREQLQALVADTNLTDEQVAEKANAIVGPTQGVADSIWQVLVYGLLAVAMISLGFLAWAVLDKSNDTSPDLFVTTFTAALSGLLGLFVSPKK